jgi:ABC-type hemin transport system substrate-binding protein
MLKSMLKISTAATIIFFLLVALLFTCNSPATAQTTTYVINPEAKCDSITLATYCLKTRNRVVGRDNKSNKDIWQSSKGSYFIIMIPKTGNCAYKKYLKNI